ncbi:hypothetical protein JMUB6875_65000 [Nocardia sp. JMUB6875]
MRIRPESNAVSSLILNPTRVPSGVRRGTRTGREYPAVAQRGEQTGRECAAVDRRGKRTGREYPTMARRGKRTGREFAAGRGVANGPGAECSVRCGG